MSEPPEDNQDCEDVAYAFVNVRDIMMNKKDLKEKDIPCKKCVVYCY